MIQDPRIIDNIKKLKELGMSDEDIKGNLIKMGLSSEDCDELIAASNGNETIKEEKEPKKKIEKRRTSEKRTKKQK